MVLAAMMMAASVAASSAVADGFQVPERHRPNVVMGRDYWRELYRYGDFILWRSNPSRGVRYDNPEIYDVPAFTDTVPNYFARRDAPPPEYGSPVWRTLAENFDPRDPDAIILTSNPQPDRPLSVSVNCKRNLTAWGGTPQLDREGYAKWRAAHPNLMFDGQYAEWDNDLVLAYSRKEKLDAKTRAAIEEVIGKTPPKDRYERCRVMKRYFDKRRETYYGGDIMVFVAHVYSLHLGADFGAKMLSLETTNSSGSPTSNAEYRWNTAAMFARGAARQFRLNWEWYIAGYMNGASKEGEWQGNIVTVYPYSDDAPERRETKTGWSGPEYGQSLSVMRRAHYFAYLNGPNFQNLEEWSSRLTRWDRTAKKTVLTARGREYVKFADFTRAHPERGAVWTPVAICVPVAQGYTTYGGSPWAVGSYGYTRGDEALDAIFYTLVPGFERAKAMMAGGEMNLHNSPYAQMYDVIAPDASSQSDAEKLEVFRSYKAIVVAGDYPDRSFEKVLAEYEKGGGRVIRIGEADVPPIGKDNINSLRAGRFSFPKVAKVFDGLQADYFPFKVTGYCLYGANRNEKGWWLWIFNNKGVTKFARDPHVVDHAFDAKIEVSSAKARIVSAHELLGENGIKVVDGSFSFTLPAGELAIFEIPCGKD
ncbi:MAG: hypothetical protein IKO72_06575 [Kiritimatiellae bacterium]|nr:hypothetical protein [Kiritimatiellia bacterium]